MIHTHSHRLERWVGSQILEDISANMRTYQGPPIPIAGVPGLLPIYAVRGGEFVGVIRGGGFASLADLVTERLKRISRNVERRQRGKLNTGFSSLSDLISEATAGGKRQDFTHMKTGTGAVSGRSYSLWNVGSFPAAGGTPAARPGGAVPTNATVGATPFIDPGGSDTLHYTTLQSQGSTAPNTLIFLDRTFHAGSFNHATTSAQSVTGVPTRYATTTSPGIVVFLEVTTVLNATVHNITLQYVDNAGNAAENAAVIAAITSSAVTQIPHFPIFIPYNAGDTGARSVTNITFSAAATGTSSVVMAKPLVWVPQPVANSMVVMDGINSAFSFAQLLAGACVMKIELKGVGSATSYIGTSVMVSG